MLWLSSSSHSCIREEELLSLPFDLEHCGRVRVWSWCDPLPVHVIFIDSIIQHIRLGAAASKVRAPLLFSYHSYEDENPHGQRDHIAGGCNGLNHFCEIHQSSFCQGALRAANEIFMKWWASLINISPREWQCWVASSASHSGGFSHQPKCCSSHCTLLPQNGLFPVSAGQIPPGRLINPEWFVVVRETRVLTENTEVFLVTVRSYLDTRHACANSKGFFILWEHVMK